VIITEHLLPINQFSRPGHKRKDTLAIVYHWVGNAGQSQTGVARYFELLSKQDSKDDKPDRYASAHYVIGIEGDIVRCIPDDEIAYHVGAKEYTSTAQHRLRGYTTNNNTPNWCTIGIEMCHPDWSGVFTTETLQAAIKLGKHLIHTYMLGPHDVYRHYDITGKSCPKWLVEHETAWLMFRDDIQRSLGGDSGFYDRERGI
jgi:N-acetylmuramoyl-L-alanine amidase